MEGRDGAESLPWANVANGSTLLALLQVIPDRLLIVHGQPRVHMPTVAHRGRVQSCVSLQCVTGRSLDASSSKIGEVHA